MLTDEQAKDAVNSAIKEFSKYKPIQKFDSVTTVKDQAGYPLSSKERILKVTQVFYSTMPMYPLVGYWPEFTDLGRLEGLSVFENPSLWLQYMQRFEKYREIFDGDFSYDPDTKTLTLIPPPGNSGDKVYFVWTQRHTAATILEDDYDTFLLWAKAEAKEMMSGRLGSQIRSVSGYGESVSLGATPDSLMKESNDFRTRFVRKFGSAIITVG